MSRRTAAVLLSSVCAALVGWVWLVVKALDFELADLTDDVDSELL